MTKEMVANLEHRKDSDFTNQGCVPWSDISMRVKNTI